MSIEPDNYSKLLENIKTILEELRTAVGIEIKRAAWKIGDAILYPKAGKPKSESVTQNNPKTSFKTQQQLAQDLGLKQQRISEFINFRKVVGNDFDLWVKSRICDSEILLERRDIRYFLTPPPKQLTTQDIEKKQLAVQRQIEKRQKEDSDLRSKVSAEIQASTIQESIDMLTNKLIEGYEFPEYCIGLLKTLADEIKKRYPDK